MRDLLRLPAQPGLPGDFPPDPEVSSDRFGVEASDLTITTSHWKAYQRAAEALATLVTADPSALDRILPAPAKSGDPTARIAAFVEDFLPRAYRRTVTTSEIAQVVALGEALPSSDTSDPFVLRVRWILTAVLQSPNFLYRIEVGAGVPRNGRVRLSEYELASKLSYALWGTMPDDRIVDYAKSGMLATNTGIGTVAKEMLADVRADVVLADFHDRLFLVDHYGAITREPKLFPRYYPEFPVDAREDIRRTVRELVIKNPGGVRDLYASTVAFVNAPLAPVYGINPRAIPALVKDPTSFTRVSMDRTRRIGVLMHPGWLAYHGGPAHPSIIRRGVFLARRVLCLPLGAPPPGATGADPSRSTQPTNRRRVEEMTKGCGNGCHGGESGIINPLGSSLESLDSLGQFRTMDGAFPVDSTGTVTAVGAFTGAVPLFQKLSSNARVHACYAAHWSSYLNGTGRVDATATWLSPIVAASLRGASVRDLITALVQTDAFVTVSR